MHNPPQGFIQKHQGSYKSERPNNFAGIDKVHLKRDCSGGSIVKSARELFLLSRSR